MKARIVKPFKFAIGGNRVIEIAEGAIVEGRCAEVALKENGCGVPVEPPAPVPEPAVKMEIRTEDPRAMAASVEKMARSSKFRGK